MKLNAAQLKQFNSALEVLRKAEEALSELVTDIASELRTDYEDKSDKWAESEAGEAANTMIDEWEAFAIDSQAEAAESQLPVDSNN